MEQEIEDALRDAFAYFDSMAILSKEQERVLNHIYDALLIIDNKKGV